MAEAGRRRDAAARMGGKDGDGAQLWVRCWGGYRTREMMHHANVADQQWLSFSPFWGRKQCGRLAEGTQSGWPAGRLAGSATLASSQGKNLFVTLFFRFLIKNAVKLAGAYITCWLRNFQLLVFAHGFVCGEHIKLQRRHQHK